MANKDDELDAWRYRFPSGAVSWNFMGDPVYCQQFIGEAKNMLRQLKNRMNIAVPKLKSLQDTRPSKGGTTIAVRSIFGQDFVTIDASKTTLGRGQKCTVTFIDFPLYVPPMQNPGKILPEEVRGVDYFKTYYSVDISKCSTCEVISWEFLFRYLQSSPLVPEPIPPLPISTRIEWPIEPLHHHDYDADGLLIDHDGFDHTIYSESPPAWGEVISYGKDSEGTYIIWKAYTEAKDGIISRTGLGIMRMVARIKDNRGVEVCAQNERIEVDCCLKADEDRPIVINWQKCIISEWCAAPDFDSINTLAYFQTWSWILMNLKAGGDGCIPYEWSLSGMGEIVPAWGDRKFVTYKVPAWQFYARNCHDTVFIRGDDRCGTSDSIFFKSCCDSDPAPLSIGYTSLLMSCDGSQTLTANGGCGPYSWSLSGGGTIVPISPGSGTATYTAPATNPNCTQNPTITLTECCGNTAQVKLAVNCYTGTLTAYRDCQMMFCAHTCLLDGSWHFHGVFGAWRYGCDGTFLGASFIDGNPHTSFTCRTSPNLACTQAAGISGGGWDCPNYYCGGSFWGACGPDQCCGTIKDIRTQAMKDAGCCPINPLTGLPY